MEILSVLVVQIIKMFLMMFIGYVLFKKKMFNDDAIKQISNFLVRFIIPCVLVTSFIREFNVVDFKNLGITFALSFVAIAIGIVYANIVYKKGNTNIEKFGVIFSNASFIGIPIISALFGKDAVFYLSAYIATFIISVWTYGIFLISEDKAQVSFKKVITNPNIIAIILGLVLYITPIQLPEIFADVLRSVGAMNTPLSMIVLGTYLAKDSLIKLFTNKKCYIVALNRLLIVPIFTIIFLKFIPNEYNILKLIVLVDNSVPSANMLAIFSQMFDKDSTYGAHIVSFTTVACIVTIPIIVFLSQMIWR